MSIAYRVYSNSGVGDPINYTSPVAVVSSGTSWTTAALGAGGDYWFGVRAFDTVSGLEEQNIDCVTEIVLDASVNDITNRPFPPIGMRAFASSGGSIKAEWIYGSVNRSRNPIGFNVYIGVGSVPNYSQPAAVVSYSAAIRNSFSAILVGLIDSTSYAVAVRAYNAAGEETNTNVMTVVAKVAGPLPVVGLSATAVV